MAVQIERICHSPNSRDGQRCTRGQSFGQCLLTGKEKVPERIIIEMTAEELIGICPSVVDYNENYTVQSLEISKIIQEEKTQNILNGTGDNLMLKNSKGSQYDEDADHSPFYGDGIIAIDACTPLSKKINCLVLEDFD